MGVFALIFLPFRVISIFSDFTFTDAEDFGPILSLLIGLTGATLIRRSLQDKASLPLVYSMLLLGLGPILPNLGLFCMAYELESVHGSWPQVMVDDPKNLFGRVSPKFDAIFHLVNYLEAFSGAWMIIFLALFFAVKANFSRQQRKLIVGTMLISLVIVLVDPGNLYAWWMD